MKNMPFGPMGKAPMKEPAMGAGKKKAPPKKPMKGGGKGKRGC